jgi:SAM-dependent methyltransferase
VCIAICLAAFFLSISAALAAEDNGSKTRPGDATAPREDAIPDVMYIPTPPDVVDAMLQLADVGKDDVVYDLGCGDGRILIAAAGKFGCRAIGCDIDPLRIAAARNDVRKNTLNHLIQIEHRDLFNVDLRSATVVTLYLSPGYNRRLIPQFRNMSPGSRIVSHQFGIHGLVPDKVVRMKSRHDAHVHVLYRWTVPFRDEASVKR